MKNDTINPATYLNPFYSIDLTFMAWLILRVIYYWAVLFQWRWRGEMELDIALMGISITCFWLIRINNWILWWKFQRNSENVIKYFRITFLNGKSQITIIIHRKNPRQTQTSLLSINFLIIFPCTSVILSQISHTEPKNTRHVRKATDSQKHMA
jgi:hypothetical protein